MKIKRPKHNIAIMYIFCLKSSSGLSRAKMMYIIKLAKLREVHIYHIVL